MHVCVFSFLGGRKNKGVTVDLGLSMFNCLGHNLECAERMAVIPDSQVRLRGDSLRPFQDWSFGYVSELGQKRTVRWWCCC